jgi:hypothetical protein
MSPKIKTFVKTPLYAFLLGIYPVLALYAHNVNEIQVSNLWRPLFLSLGGVLVLFLLFRLIFKNWQRAALLTTILVVMFFAYGHVYSSLKTVPFAAPFTRHRLLLPVWGLLIGFGLWLTARKSTHPEKAAPILNIVGVVAFVFPLIQMGTYFIRSQHAQADAPRKGFPGLRLPTNQAPPDIYYIILDAYGNTKTLDELMNFDNTEFLNALRAQGFYVPDCSQSNYGSTELSLVSSLNLNYLSAFEDAFVPGSNDRSNLQPFFKGNATRYSLHELGYQIVAFETGFFWSQWQDADLYLSPSRFLWSGWNEFEDLLVKTSVLRALYDMNILIKPNVKTSPHRERVLYVLDSLKVLPSMPGPKFVFVHLLMPHDPFDFGPDGEYVESWSSADRASYFEGYRRQVIYISKVIPEVTAAIIANSPTPPVIIIQGDHGPSYNNADLQRMGILNAYYLPEGSEALYNTITPVNTFRIIFNTYFGGKFDLLDDVSYMSPVQDPFTVTKVPNPCTKK